MGRYSSARRGVIFNSYNMTAKKTDSVKFFSTEGMFKLTYPELIRSIRDGVVISVATGCYQSILALQEYISFGTLDFSWIPILTAFCVGFLGAMANRFANVFRIKTK